MHWPSAGNEGQGLHSARKIREINRSKDE